LPHLAHGLSALSAHVDPKEVAGFLTQAISKTTDRTALGYLAPCLSAVSARLEPKEAAPILTQAMSKTEDPFALKDLAQTLSAVSARLEPKEAAQRCGQAAAALTQAMSKTMSKYEPMWVNRSGLELRGLAQALSAAAARLEPKEAARLCGRAAAILLQAMSKTTGAPFEWALQYLAEGLSAVAARLEPKEAARLCGRAAASLIQAMSKTTDWGALRYLAEGLAAVSAHLEPKEAGEVAGALIQAVSSAEANAFKSVAQNVWTFRQPNSAVWVTNVLPSLAQSVSVVLTHLEPKDAAAIVTQAISKTTDPAALQKLAHAVPALAARLEPKEAAQLSGQAVAILIQAMSMTTDPNALKDLAQALSAVSARELSPQTLVDLLKHPCCTGEPRRLVLDQLARYYHRAFADQWDFVDYVRQRKLRLDFTTPPARSRMLPQAPRRS
jgi:hypothetical protein